MLNNLKKFIRLENKKKFIYSLLGLKESYSQGPEDLLFDLYFKKVKKGTYVDIGANHPTKFNNFYLLYKRGWSGINVEPNFNLYKKMLSKRPKDINLNIGIGTGEKLDFYLMQPDTLSTFDKSTAENYKNLGHKIIDIKKINTLTLENIFDKYIGDKKIDILSVDVEGFDMEVLKSNNWKKYKPEYIILETVEYTVDGKGKKLNYIFDKYLDEKGYIKIADTHINTIYKLNI